MKRREFLAAGMAAATVATTPAWLRGAFGHEHACDDRTYATPLEAMQSPREKLAYCACLYVGSSANEPDYLATIDVDPESPTFSQVVHRLDMPYVGDELHHYGWNACSSCHADPEVHRRFLVLPGLRSNRIYIVDTQEPAQPKMHHVVEPGEVRAANLSAPHTVHCLPSGEIMISMLGDADGRAPGGFLLLDADFRVVGSWERDASGMEYNYDFWYQPRHGVMVSSEWAAPQTNFPGFRLEDVEAGRYGRRLHFWDWENRSVQQSFDLGADGLIPLEVRFHHDPDSTHGFVGAALSSKIWHWHRPGDEWQVEPVISVESQEVEGWPFPVPGLITDILLSMDDRWLYFSNWLHGDVRQYDISDPSRPRLAGRLWCGGVLGQTPTVRGKRIEGGPQMLQLSLDGKRLYVTNSLFSSWDNQFYPDLGKNGSSMLLIDCDTDRGGLSLNEDFAVDFGNEPRGPARAHETRFPGGDCTSDIWV